MNLFFLRVSGYRLGLLRYPPVLYDARRHTGAPWCTTRGAYSLLND
jgi:hypothetical protein